MEGASADAHEVLGCAYLSVTLTTACRPDGNLSAGHPRTSVSRSHLHLQPHYCCCHPPSRIFSSSSPSTRALKHSPTSAVSPSGQHTSLWEPAPTGQAQ